MPTVQKKMFLTPQRLVLLSLSLLAVAAGVFFLSLRFWRTPGIGWRPTAIRPMRVVDPLTDATVLPIAVMVENSVDARPLSGLHHAQTVFETVAEGGITRFLAIYATSTPSTPIGPVRSARPYYVEWASMFGGLYGHVGGSPAALELLAHAPVSDRDEFSYGTLYTRTANRDAPHNAYTTLVALRSSLATSTAPLTRVQPWQYEQRTTSTTSSLRLHIDFSRPAYAVDWVWDDARQGFVRSIGGR
jgi:hypothetical protein